MQKKNITELFKNSILLASVKPVMQTKLPVPKIIVFRGGEIMKTDMIVVSNDMWLYVIGMHVLIMQF